MFISFEGIEGSGKTTQLEYVCQLLEKNGKKCVITREPGGTKIGEKIRSILLDRDSKNIDPVTELLLYVADRVQHIKEVIKPGVAGGRIILCDRYFDATMVYQGYARGIEKHMLKELHRLTCGNLMPDITFLLDLPPEIGLNRAWMQINRGERAGNETRFEEEKLSFHQKVRSGYLDLAEVYPSRFHVIDAEKEVEKVRDEILQGLSLKLSINLE